MKVRGRKVRWSSLPVAAKTLVSCEGLEKYIIIKKKDFLAWRSGNPSPSIASNLHQCRDLHSSLTRRPFLIVDDPSNQTPSTNLAHLARWPFGRRSASTSVLATVRIQPLSTKISIPRRWMNSIRTRYRSKLNSILRETITCRVLRDVGNCPTNVRERVHLQSLISPCHLVIAATYSPIISNKFPVL
jgi:hypothetical protein